MLGQTFTTFFFDISMNSPVDELLPALVGTDSVMVEIARIGV
jgi:hypothetical protein